MRTIKRAIAGAFIFSSDNQLLLGKTGSDGTYRDLWVVPGGGIEEGETKLEAMKREIKEEVGLELDDAKIEAVNTPSSGESEKTLKETRERVSVKMTFWDFYVYLPKVAKDIRLSMDDDFSEGQFFPLDSLSKLNLGAATRASLKSRGYLGE